MFPVIKLGPLAIQTAGFFILASIWFGITLAGQRASKHGLQPGHLENLILYGLIGFLIGGRITYAASHLGSFRETPLDIFSANTLLFNPPGGLAIAFIISLVYGSRQKLPFWSALDALTPFFAILLVGIGASHLASGTAYGKETSLPWGIVMHGAVRHPSQLYELFAALLILFFIGLARPHYNRGILFLTFTGWTAGAHLFLEAFRGDSNLFAGGYRISQLLAWAVLAVSLAASERLQSTKAVS